jgi:hypothetical protein
MVSTHTERLRTRSAMKSQSGSAILSTAIRCLSSALLCLAGALPCPASSQEELGRGADPDRSEVLSRIADLLESNFVLTERAKEMADAFRTRSTSGAYDGYVESTDFAAAVTTDLVAITGDSHTLFRVIEPTVLNEAPVSPMHHPLRLFRLGQDEHLGINRLEWYPGHVGYLDLTRIYPLSESREMVDAAIRFLSLADAVIIDLRENGGGSGESLPYLCGFFLPGSTQLTSYISTQDGFLKEFWTSEEGPHESLADVPLFLLTSERTFSAAEMFAYDMQVLGRATAVGDPTGGGANSVDLFPIDEEFEIYISTSRAINPITGGNWEGSGVIPDVRVPEEVALDTALALAKAAGSVRADAREATQRAAIAEMESRLERAVALLRGGDEVGGSAEVDSLFAIAERAGLISEFFLDVLAYNYFGQEHRLILLQLLEKKVARFPSSPGFELLGDANAMVGDTVQAVEAYQRSLELDPSNRNAAKRIRRLRGRQGTPNEGEMGALRDTP